MDEAHSSQWCQRHKALSGKSTNGSNQPYTAKITFDATYFLPEYVTSGTIEENTVRNMERQMTIKGTTVSLSRETAILTEIGGTVLLGNTNPAMLKILSFNYNEPDISVKTKDGSLTVTGVCNQGFSNLVIAENLVFEITENPVNDELTINIRGKRSEGEIKLEIYNVLGECVMVTDVLHLEGVGHLNKFKIDVSGLAAGVYFVRLGNWTGKFVKIE